MVRSPALYTKEMGDLAITIPAILFGRPDHRQTQLFVIMLLNCDVALSAAGKANRFAGPQLRCIQLLTNINHRLKQISDCQAFGIR